MTWEEWDQMAAFQRPHDWRDRPGGPDAVDVFMLESDRAEPAGDPGRPDSRGPAQVDIVTGRTVGRGARPLLPTAIWQEVVDRADGRCECRKGACGNRHTSEPKVTKPCRRTTADGWALYVVGPPGMSDTHLARLDPGQLHAYCQECATGIARVAGHGARAKPGPDTNQGDLLEGL